MQSNSRLQADLFLCAFADTTTAWNALCPTPGKELNISFCLSFSTSFPRRMRVAEALPRAWASALPSCARSFVCMAARSKHPVAEETEGQHSLCGCRCALAKRLGIIGSNSDTRLQIDALISVRGTIQ